MSRSKKLIVTALFLIGACILLYPAVSNKLAERHQAEMISRYEQTVEELPKTDMKSEWEKAVKYNESVTGMSVEDPFILGSVRRACEMVEAAGDTERWSFWDRISIRWEIRGRRCRMGGLFYVCL